jgi:rhamnogalacturonan endolyase
MNLMKCLKRTIVAAACFAAAAVFVPVAHGQYHMENLGRGVAAVNEGNGKVFVSWRLLGTDPDGIAFNVYRATAGAAPVKLNNEPLTQATSFQDGAADLTRQNEYFVKPVINGQEGEISKPFLSKVAANAPAQNYFSIKLQSPGEQYAPNDCSAADLDGDGEYEIIVHMAGHGQDNAFAGMTDEPIFQAYKMDGTLMWTINLGHNVREGAHYTHFMVADFDGDGKAEMIVKTADGTRDGTGKVIGDANADWRAKDGFVLSRDRTGGRQENGQLVADLQGRILSGPEYLTVFEGATGKALATTDYVPQRGNVADWGDAYANRSDRFLASVAYLDGKLPSAIMCRGYYTRTVLAAWDWRDGKLTQRWVFDSHDPAKPDNRRFAGQGNHNMSVADVDGDGKQEIVYGAMSIDDDGTGIYTTGLGHGDAIHVSDMDPTRPGLEIMDIHENPRHKYGFEFRDAKTGEIIWGKPGIEGQNSPDVGRGVAFDIDPGHLGYEVWSSLSGLYDCKGELISQQKPSSVNFGIWWDGDLLRELLNGNTISKWDWENNRTNNLFRAEGCQSNNGTKSTPALSGDLFGDWREEVILRTADNSELRVFTTTIPTEHRLITLMHDPQYRVAIAWQNTAYNQPPHPGFYLGAGMKPVARPNITTAPIGSAGN